MANVCHLSSLKLDALSFRSKNLTSLHLSSSHLLLGECQAWWKKNSHTTHWVVCEFFLSWTQALTYVLKYSGSAKRAQPDQEWKDDVNDHAFLFPYFPSTVEPVSSGHLVLTLKLPGSNC